MAMASRFGAISRGGGAKSAGAATPLPAPNPSPGGGAPAGTGGATGGGGGKTAGGGSGKKTSGGTGTMTPWIQPPFDTRIRTLSKPFGTGQTPVTRGFMVWDKSLQFPAGYKWPGSPAVVSFLFNPSTISTSYSMENMSAAAALEYPTMGSGSQVPLPVNVVPLSQQVGFSLYFDRTYELNTPAVLAAYPTLSVLGVDADVMALRQYCGMFATAGLAGGSTTYAYSIGVGKGYYNVNTGNPDAPWFNTQGIMQMTLGFLFFSGMNATPTSPTNPGGGPPSTITPLPGATPGSYIQGLQYYGYVDSFDVQYTHFTQTMVPMRCVVDVSFTLLPPPITSDQQVSAILGEFTATQTMTGVAVGTGAPIGPGSTGTPGGLAGTGRAPASRLRGIMNRRGGR